MATIIVTNDSTSEIYIEDMSWQSIASGETIDLSELYTYDEISDSIQLKELINDNIFRLHDGVKYLTKAEAIDHLTASTVYETPEHLDDLPEVPPIEAGKILEGADSTSCIWVEKPTGGGLGGDNDFVINVSFAGTKPYAKCKSTSFSIIGSFIFYGSSVVGEPKNFEIVAWSKNGQSGTVRLVDYDSGDVIGEIGVSSGTKSILSDTSLNNIPTGKSILEIQGKTTNSKKELYIEAVTLRF